MTEQTPTDPLVGLASRLSGVHSVAEVAGVALSHAAAALDADACLLAIPTEAGRRLHLLREPSDAESMEDTPLIPLGEGTPIAEAVRTGKPVVADAPSDLGATGSTAAVADLATVLAVPLEAMVGVTGGVGFGWRDAHTVTADEEERATIVAQWVGVSLERTLAREREHRFVQAIRGDLMRSVDVDPGVEVVGMYRPPWSGMPLGGDWYDAVRLDDGRILLVVGDVAGHGIDVAPTMLSVRGYLRSIAYEDDDPVSCLARLESTMRHYEGGDDSLVSVVVAVLDVPSGEVRWANGGLPPPILRRADGTVSVLGEGRSRLLGTGLRRHSDEPAVAVLRSGDAIVTYTDGLFAPMDSSTVDVDDVRDAVATQGAGDLEALCRSLMGLSEHADLRTDDATVLAVRLR